MKTTRGIELDLEKSEYVFTCNGLRLYFSSKFYLEKFASEIQNYIDVETRKNELRYKTKIRMTPLLIISLYKKIEKRGFKIYDTLRKKDLSQEEEFLLYYQH